MKKLPIILLSCFIISCNSNFRKNEIQIVHDTLRIIEKNVDTIYIEISDTNDVIKSNYDEISDTDDFSNTEFYIQERLPEWFLNTATLNGVDFQEEYEFDNRLNPLYLEADFNGDTNIDIVIPIKQKENGKVGFAIIHGETYEIFIIGAGKEVKNGLSDNMSYIDIWKINRKKSNEPGLDENGEINKNGPLILKNPSIQVEKSEVGGGQIYWDGNEYIYFHQTC